MEMEAKENGYIQDEWWSAPASPNEVLQKFPKEGIEKVGHSHLGSPVFNTPSWDPAQGHRRSRSELSNSIYRRSSSTINFQKWKSQVQRALRWRSRSFQDDREDPFFDPEIMANQKRQWYKLQSKTLDPDKFKEPTSLFEHFFIAGLRPDANLEAVEDALAKRKKLEQEMASTEMLDFGNRLRRPTFPALEPQVLFMYPPVKEVGLRLHDVAAFCFPGGVKVGVLERTPSLTELNEVVYGQEHLSRDDLSFIFSLKVADNATLYGVCLYVREFVQKPPAMSLVSSPLSQSNSGFERFLVSAPRCYCILTKVPFFELHYEMLNSIITQERLHWITQFVSEVALSDYVPSPPASKSHMNGNFDSPGGESDTEWRAATITVDSEIALSSGAGITLDEEVPSSRWELYSPGSATPSDTSDVILMREPDKDGDKNMYSFDDRTPENSVKQPYGFHCNDCTSDVGRRICKRDRSLEAFRSFSSFSSARSMASEDEDDDIFDNRCRYPSDDITTEKDNRIDLLQIISGYYSIPLPERGSKIVFQPLDHLPSIEYRRPSISDLGFCGEYLDPKLNGSREVSQILISKIKLKLAAAEEAHSLSLWSTATICRVLSLQNVLTLVTSMLLEKQVVVLCPNLGVLSAVVLSLIPIIRPFEWQSLFLPILPIKLLDFLDAPVPFVVGVQQKIAELKMRRADLVHVNLVKDQVKSCSLPQLPKRKELIAELKPIHSVLSSDDSVSLRQPVYKCNQAQAEAAEQFLAVMRRYLESLCSDLMSHTITNVQSNNDRVSMLLKDSFIDSFADRDQPFVKLFVETQLFTVLSDFRLSSFESERQH